MAMSYLLKQDTPCSSNTERNCEVFNAVNNEDDDYVIPAEATSKMPPNKQYYESLDVLRRKDDEHEYQSLVKISYIDGSERAKSWLCHTC